jgi:hypothetical protein
MGGSFASRYTPTGTEPSKPLGCRSSAEVLLWTTSVSRTTAVASEIRVRRQPAPIHPCPTTSSCQCSSLRLADRDPSRTGPRRPAASVVRGVQRARHRLCATFAGTLRPSDAADHAEDYRGYSLILAVSGTPGDECLNWQAWLRSVDGVRRRSTRAAEEDATLTANARAQGGLSVESHFPLIPFAMPR